MQQCSYPDGRRMHSSHHKRTDHGQTPTGPKQMTSCCRLYYVCTAKYSNWLLFSWYIVSNTFKPSSLCDIHPPPCRRGINHDHYKPISLHKSCVVPQLKILLLTRGPMLLTTKGRVANRRPPKAIFRKHIDRPMHLFNLVAALHHTSPNQNQHKSGGTYDEPLQQHPTIRAAFVHITTTQHACSSCTCKCEHSLSTHDNFSHDIMASILLVTASHQ